MLQLDFENGSREVSVCVYFVIFVYPVSAPQTAGNYRSMRKKKSEPRGKISRENYYSQPHSQRDVRNVLSLAPDTGKRLSPKKRTFL